MFAAESCFFSVYNFEVASFIDFASAVAQASRLGSTAIEMRLANRLNSPVQGSLPSVVSSNTFRSFSPMGLAV